MKRACETTFDVVQRSQSFIVRLWLVSEVEPRSLQRAKVNGYCETAFDGACVVNSIRP
jgi:hypothetical protein